jgi:hypothetical protein
MYIKNKQNGVTYEIQWEKYMTHDEITTFIAAANIATNM